MHLNRSNVILLAVCLFLSLGAVASGKQATEKAPQAERLTALYMVPDLDGALAKDLIKSLKELEGLVSAKPDLEAGSFAVTFETTSLTQAELEQALREVAPELSLKKVGPAAHDHSGCGKCPRKNTCADAKKDH